MANSYAKKFFAELKRDNISDDGAVVITSRKFGLEPTEVREFIGQIKDVELDEPYDNMTKERWNQKPTDKQIKYYKYLKKSRIHNYHFATDTKAQMYEAIAKLKNCPEKEVRSMACKGKGKGSKKGGAKKGGKKR